MQVTLIELVFLSSLCLTISSTPSRNTLIPITKTNGAIPVIGLKTEI